MYRNIYNDKLNIVEESKLLGSDKSKTTIVQDIQNLFEYLNGTRTKNIAGRRLTVLCPDGKSLSIKLLNEVKDLDKIQVGMRVHFINLTGKIYCDTHNKLALSCSAEGWEEVNV